VQADRADYRRLLGETPTVDDLILFTEIAKKSAAVSAKDTRERLNAIRKLREHRQLAEQHQTLTLFRSLLESKTWHPTKNEQSHRSRARAAVETYEVFRSNPFAGIKAAEATAAARRRRRRRPQRHQPIELTKPANDVGGVADEIAQCAHALRRIAERLSMEYAQGSTPAHA
jgi:hypothetical protein